MKVGTRMRRHSYMEITSLVVFLSILTIVLQFLSYYFFASIYLILGISCLVSIICNHILQEQSMTYQTSFIYTFLTVFISLIIMFLTLFGKDREFFSFDDIIIGIVVLNWIVPLVHGYIRNMFDGQRRIEDFPNFFRNSSLLFIFFYLAILGYSFFSVDSFPWAYQVAFDQPNFHPFWSISIHIEDYLDKMIPLTDIFIYLASRILIFIPYGYYTILIFRRRSRLFRFLVLLSFPLAIEILQYCLIPGRCDIDDMIYGLIGGLLGALWFYFNNMIYRLISGKDFLAKHSDLRYLNRSIHF